METPLVIDWEIVMVHVHQIILYHLRVNINE